MSVFGIIMVLAAVQLLGVGSVIQRGNVSLIPDNILANINNLPEYARMFGNRLILLGLIAIVCAIMSFSSSAFTMRPVIVFGVGILLAVVLLILDYRKFSR